MENPSPIDRVIVQDETKLARYEGVMAYLDSRVYDFTECELEIASPVPVHSPDMQKIGFAEIHLEDQGGPLRLVGSLSIDYATEERFESDLDIRPFYPRIFGRLLMPGQATFDFAARMKVLRLSVEGVKLCTEPPTDGRIKRVAFKSI